MMLCVDSLLGPEAFPVNVSLKVWMVLQDCVILYWEHRLDYVKFAAVTAIKVSHVFLSSLDSIKRIFFSQ